jgi:hypothetical protein
MILAGPRQRASTSKTTPFIRLLDGGRTLPAGGPTRALISSPTAMEAARLTPREEDVEGSPPAFSHTYRITVEGFDGSTHEHQFAVEARRLDIGEVIRAGQEGWFGPTIAIEEIDRHPDAVQAGVALVHPAAGWR